MNRDKFLDYGIEITGAAVPSLLSVAIGDPSAGVAAQFLVICAKELADYVIRPQSEREAARSAASVIYAYQEISRRIELGENIRDDDFFREKIGVKTNANTVLEGVLVKAKQQYEESKVKLIGHLMAEVAFNRNITADDACWYLNLVDSLNYQSLLILAAFYMIDENKWADNNLSNIYKHDRIIAQQIRQLRGHSLLTPQGTFATNVTLTESGKFLVESMMLIDELNIFGEKIKNIVIGSVGAVSP